MRWRSGKNTTADKTWKYCKDFFVDTYHHLQEKKYRALRNHKNIGGRVPPTQNATKAYQKSKYRENCPKHCDPNGYCLSCCYEVTENHNRTTCNWKVENHVATIKYNNATRCNMLGGSTRNKPSANTWQRRECILKPINNIIGAIQINTTRTPTPCNANLGIKN